MGAAGETCDQVCLGLGQVCNVDTTVSKLREAWSTAGSADGIKSVMEANGGVCINGANNQDYYSLPGIGNGNCEISDNYGTADVSVMFNCLGSFATVERLCYCSDL
ncbi:hypothetical protein SARC_09050 [Sphaeroforma arctica JP610]|uniref:Uncharacterized protein n=1 Tax=Sphaeroforma arctica JP610 TaxID=667725 RepID=A0A0L0FNW3_9EUKA|nr:hypothetical protein SARC_09050 [Sphaeroforma arctica JP610]KNC78525.1 hypothetical protein SARC_09050 [Sphaeroforma arctica JP610]|eukprot:XP_014152427.1 hypothetical protein SARC_09050 [Sphaeroforma arctica JP610]